MQILMHYNSALFNSLLFSYLEEGDDGQLDNNETLCKYVLLAKYRSSNFVFAKYWSVWSTHIIPCNSLCRICVLG